MDNMPDDLYVFAEENPLPTTANPTWKLLILDDDDDIHRSLRDVFSEFSFNEKKVTIFNAYSTADAISTMQEHPDIAAVLLDIYMQESESGLTFVKYLRETLKNHSIQIIIFTEKNYPAHPGLKNNIVLDYDIDDYIEKTDITPEKIFSIVVMALRSFQHLTQIEAAQKETQNIANAMDRFLPHMFLKILNRKSIVDVKLSDHIEKEMSILFLDIRSFTSISEFSTPLESFRFINECMSSLEPVILQHQGFVDKHIGDAIMALFPENADDAIAAGIAMLHSLEIYNRQRILNYEMPVKIGIGINTGLVVLGVIGFHGRTDCTVIGDTVNAAERVEKICKKFGSSLLISEQTFSSLKNPQKFHHRSLGKVHIPGKRRTLLIFEIFDADPPDIVALKESSKPLFEEAVSLYQMGDTIAAHRLFSHIIQCNKHDLAAHSLFNLTAPTLRRRLSDLQ